MTRAKVAAVTGLLPRPATSKSAHAAKLTTAETTRIEMTIASWPRTYHGDRRRRSSYVVRVLFIFLKRPATRAKAPARAAAYCPLDASARRLPSRRAQTPGRTWRA